MSSPRKSPGTVATTDAEWIGAVIRGVIIGAPMAGGFQDERIRRAAAAISAKLGGGVAQTTNCDCGFTAEVCKTNPCMRKKLATSGLATDAEYPYCGVPQPLGVAQQPWQPIETALKDGTPILVDFGKHGIHRVIWDNPFDWGEGTKIWCVDDQKHGPYPLRGYSESDEAGWMPLPPPSNQGASK